MCEFNCLKGISKLNRCEILALTDSVSMLLSEGLDNDDLNMLGNLVSAIGTVITAFASIQQTTTPPTQETTTPSK